MSKKNKPIRGISKKVLDILQDCLEENPEKVYNLFRVGGVIDKSEVWYSAYSLDTSPTLQEFPNVLLHKGYRIVYYPTLYKHMDIHFPSGESKTFFYRSYWGEELKEFVDFIETMDKI